MSKLGRRLLDGRDQVQIIFQPADRRHEDVQPALPRLDAQRRADQAPRRLAMRQIGDFAAGQIGILQRFQPDRHPVAVPRLRPGSGYRPSPANRPRPLPAGAR